jgi:hypothetical protein
MIDIVSSLNVWAEAKAMTRLSKLEDNGRV